MAEPLIHEFDQVAFVVEDASETIRYLADTFGIGSWRCIQFGDSGNEKIKYGTIEKCVAEGEKIGTYSIQCCCGISMPNGVEMEIVSPYTGNSVFRHFLNRHGIGAQHLSVVVDDYDEAIARMKAAGASESQFAVVAGDELCSFMNVRDILGTDLELHKRPEIFNPPDADLWWIPGPEPEDKPETPAVFSQIEQVNIVTADLEKSLQVLEEAYGMGPWDRSEDAYAKKALCAGTKLSLQMEEPIDPQSYGAGLLAKNGSDIKSIVMRQIRALPEGIEEKQIDGAPCIDLRGALGILIELSK